MRIIGNVETGGPVQGEGRMALWWMEDAEGVCDWVLRDGKPYTRSTWDAERLLTNSPWQQAQRGKLGFIRAIGQPAWPAELRVPDGL